MRTVELRVLCEGQTEQNFVTQVLKPHLKMFRVYARAQALNPRGAGGVVPFDTLRRAIKNELGRSRKHQYVTTMIDLYALGNYPGAATIPGESVSARVERIQARMRDGLPHPRFIPYIQVHEFEALVFVDLEQLVPAFPDGEAEGAAAALRQGVRSLAPEEIDDGQSTAPSKRLIAAIPAYSSLKAIVGPGIAKRIGLAKLRESCPHFHRWIESLEGLATAES